jgi:hypothetical protein
MTTREAGQLVPPQDSPANLNTGDVVGNKNDTNAGDSLAAREVVPNADSADNDYASDVTGSKLDTTAGDSLYSLALQIIAATGTVDGLHDVPGVDSAVNLLIRDVLGNKTDTVAGTSAMALLQQLLAAVAVVDGEVGVIDGYHDVPAVDAAANLVLRDVLGQKGDTHDGDSAMARLHTLEEHAHSQSLVLPDLANAVQATSAAGAWAAYGGVAAALGTPADDFDIHYIDVIAGNNAGYQAEVLVDGVRVTEFAFQRVAAADRAFPQPVEMPVTAPGPVTVRISSSGAGAETATFKAHYHLY